MSQDLWNLILNKESSYLSVNYTDLSVQSHKNPVSLSRQLIHVKDSANVINLESDTQVSYK